MIPIVSVTEDQFTSISNLCVPLNIVSIISSLTSCVTFSFIKIYYPNLADRVSFRLVLAASFCDIGYSGHLLILFLEDATPGFFCGYKAWGIVFFNLSSMFFIVCIAFNLHLIFINEYKCRYNFEKYYFMIAFSFALFLSLLPITANMYGYNEPESDCWYRDSGQDYNLIWQWVTLFGWIYASILYCMIVVIMVIRKLSKMKKEVDDVLGSFPTSQLTSYPTIFNKTVISFVVRKVMWYPVTPLIAQFFGSFVETYAYVNRVIPYPLLLLCCIGVSLQGLLNTLVFFQDIAVTRAFQTVKLRWWIAYVNYYESHYPHRSYNKAITDEFSMLEKSNDIVDLKSLNCNHTDTIKNGSVNDDIINDDIINDIIINNINSNSNNNNNRINNSVNNNNSISQPSLLEWLRYMILIKIFSAPKSSSRIISFKLLSPINSFSENKPNIPSSLFGKDDYKQDIILDSQNDQDIYLVLPESVHLKDSSQYSSLDLLSHCLNPSTSSDPLIDSNIQTNQTNTSNTSNTINTSNTSNTNNTSNICISFNSIPNITNYMVGDDGRIDIVLVNSESTDIDLSKGIEMCNLMLKKL